ncbi:MAG TPA: Rieske 2Fe-2S domain-containing protein [Povalibacter sp.]|nr:Rieske 2Fe-2S domain-containing protein [Povalibacter sp.]
MSRYIEIPAASLPAAGARTLLQVGGHSIALFNVDGTYYAIDDRCPHAGASLFTGILTGRVVQCRAHGLRFDLATGCMPSAPGFGVRAYAIETEGDQVFIALPATEECS